MFTPKKAIIISVIFTKLCILHGKLCMAKNFPPFAVPGF